MSGSRLRDRRLPALRARTGLPVVAAKAYTDGYSLFLDGGEVVEYDRRTGAVTHRASWKWSDDRSRDSLARRLAAFKRAKTEGER